MGEDGDCKGRFISRPELVLEGNPIQRPADRGLEVGEATRDERYAGRVGADAGERIGVVAVDTDFAPRDPRGLRREALLGSRLLGTAQRTTTRPRDRCGTRRRTARPRRRASGWRESEFASAAAGQRERGSALRPHRPSRPIRGLHRLLPEAGARWEQVRQRPVAHEFPARRTRSPSRRESRRGARTESPIAAARTEARAPRTGGRRCGRRSGRGPAGCFPPPELRDV